MLRNILAALSCLGLCLGIAWTATTLGDVQPLKATALGFRGPIVTLLLSLACALAFVASSVEPSRALRRPAVIAWLLTIAGTLLVAGFSVFFRWSSGDLHPFGDPAILELYTLHAVRGVWYLGPYSQFGWHHPGPSYFYLLAPLYLLSGEKTIALHVGAFAINLLSLSAIGCTLYRYASTAVFCAGTLVLGAYVLRLEPIISNYWNPHIVILPAALYLVLTSALAAGRHGALLPSVLVGSFLVQTHISLGPYVLTLGGASLAAGAFWRERTQTPDRSSSFRMWIGASAGLTALLWLLPIVEEARHSPGNLTRIAQFFGEPSPGQELQAAVAVWGQMICALYQTDLAVPEGLPLRIPQHWTTPASLSAVAQILVLAALAVDALRRQERFHGALAACGLIASLVGLWSITRVRSLIGDYMIFWLSAIGALNWALIAGLAMTRAAGVRMRAVQQTIALATAAVVLWLFVDVGSGQLKRARRQALRPTRGGASVVQVASDAILDDMRRNRVQRPLLQMSTPDWGVAAGVLLQVYKRGRTPAVHPSLVPLFGAPLAPDGREDRLYVIADAASQAVLTQPVAGTVIGSVGDVYIHASPITPQPMGPAKR